MGWVEEAGTGIWATYQLDKALVKGARKGYHVAQDMAMLAWAALQEERYPSHYPALPAGVPQSTADDEYDVIVPDYHPTEALESGILALPEGRGE